MANETHVTMDELIKDPPTYSSQPTEDTVGQWIPTYIYKGHGSELVAGNQGNIS